MARKSKPYLRMQTKSWHCSVNGKQVALGKGREVAYQKFHDLTHAVTNTSVVQISGRYA